MAWLVGLDIALWLAAIWLVLFTPYWVAALICAILAALLVLLLTEGKLNLFDIFF